MRDKEIFFRASDKPPVIRYGPPDSESENWVCYEDACNDLYSVQQEMRKNMKRTEIQLSRQPNTIHLIKDREKIAKYMKRYRDDATIKKQVKIDLKNSLRRLMPWKNEAYVTLGLLTTLRLDPCDASEYETDSSEAEIVNGEEGMYVYSPSYNFKLRILPTFVPFLEEGGFPVTLGDKKSYLVEVGSSEPSDVVNIDNLSDVTNTSNYLLKTFKFEDKYYEVSEYGKEVTIDFGWFPKIEIKWSEPHRVKCSLKDGSHSYYEVTYRLNAENQLVLTPFADVGDLSTYLEGDAFESGRNKELLSQFELPKWADPELVGVRFDDGNGYDEPIIHFMKWVKENVDATLDGFKTNGNVDLLGGVRARTLVPEIFLMGDLGKEVSDAFIKEHGEFTPSYGPVYDVKLDESSVFTEQGSNLWPQAQRLAEELGYTSPVAISCQACAKLKRERDA